MRLVIVRHGEPDYSIDSLTPRGWKEAEILSERISRLDVKDFYCSPLGRARDTAKATLAKMGRQATRKAPGYCGTGCPPTGRKNHAFTMRTSGCMCLYLPKPVRRRNTPG